MPRPPNPTAPAAKDRFGGGLLPAFVALTLAVAAQVFTAWNAHVSVVAMNDITDHRTQARIVRLQLEQLLSALKDIETGSRGYAITGRDEFLAPYRSALADLPAIRRDLRAATASEPYEGIPWSEINALIDARIALSVQVVDRRRQSGGVGGGDSLTLLESGRQVMEQLRARFEGMEAIQERRLAELSTAIDHLQDETERLSLVSGATSLLLVLLAVALIRHEYGLRKASEAALRDSNASLEQRVAERTAELRDARDHLRDFAGRQEEAIEQERRRVAREVHDQIGQVFTAIKLIANSLPRASFPAGQADALAQALDMGITTSRRITSALRPPLLDALGLAAALQHLATTLPAGAAPRIEIAVQDEGLLDESQRLGLFRISQEALTNVLRHAEATTVRIDGAFQSSRYRFRIADDGHGYTPQSLRLGAMGLTGMSERARLIDGEFTIDTAATGTTVRVELIPHGRPDAAAGAP